MERRPIISLTDKTVVNVIMAANDYDPGDGFMLGVAGGQIGDRWNGKAYIGRDTSKDPAPVPDEITMAQARIALKLAGITPANVEAAIAGIADATQRAIAEEAWEYAPVIRRTSKFVKSLGQALGLSDKRIDALFINAAGIEL